MNLSKRDQLSFHDISKGWAKEGNHLDYNAALTLLYRGFWRTEFDSSNQTAPGQTCLTLLSQQGGHDHYDPATREFVLRVLPKGDPRCPSIGSNPTFDDLAKLDAVDYPDGTSRWPLGAVFVSKDVARHWIQDNGHPPMLFWFPDMAAQIDTGPPPEGTPRVPADFAKWDAHKSLTLGNAVNLWEGIEPMPFNHTHPDVLSRKRLLQERLFELGYRGKPGCAPSKDTVIPRETFKQLAEELGERPAFLYPDERITTTPEATTAGEAKCKLWLEKRVNAWKANGGPRPKRDELRNEAMQRFKVSRRGFENRVWASTVPDEWKKSGPKSA